MNNKDKVRYEDGLIAFESLKKNILSYGKSLSEADTRCKIIDSFLKDCLGWKEKDIRREKYANRGYIDYILRTGNKGLIIEAKRKLPLFNLPAGVDFSSRLTIGSLLKKEELLEKHYEQVLRYCLNTSLQFGCFTNGLEWVIFPAIRTDGINLYMSKLVVFCGIKDIEKNFISFWNLLSKESIEKEKINHILLPEIKHIPPSFQVNDRDRKNIILNRNILSGILSPILPEYFGDLIGPDLLPKLEKCYVDSTTLHESTDDWRKLSKTVGEDPHIQQPYTRDKVYDDLNRSISSFVDSKGRSGILYILLGRVGSGKSTFLNHYFYIRNKEISNNHLVYFLNWLEYNEQQNIFDFFYDKITDLSKQNPLYTKNSEFEILEKAFQQDIDSLRKGPLGNIKDDASIKIKISELLLEMTNKKDYYYSRLFDYLKKKKNISTILIFDNIDQLQPELQEKIIKFAFSIYESWGSFTLVSLREENYVKSKREGSLSTIQCHRILLPEQSIIPIIERRLCCFANDLAENPRKISNYLSERNLTALDLREYILLISRSIVSQQDKVKRFLEAIALGNIRDSLEFFRNFLMAGNTNSGKIIEIMKKSGNYLVPDHEFIKSIALGSKQFFSETDSAIINLFSISDMENPSHFTKLRILYMLSLIRYQSRSFGAGYENISKLISLLRSIGTSEFDVRNSIKSLTRKNLIENDLHSQIYIDQANAVRITPTGMYYLEYLCKQFAYLDLLQQDTPIFDEDIYNNFLEKYATSTLMDQRFKRCRAYIDYLGVQEKNEMAIIEKITSSDLLTNLFMPDIIENYSKNVEKIQKKYKIN